MRRTRLSARIAALVTGVALVMSACIGGGSGSSPTSVPAGSPLSGADDVSRPIVCAPPASPASVDGWVYTAYASRASGLVIKGLRFGPRLVADEMSIPYIRPVVFAKGIGHLSVEPLPGDGNLTSTLVSGPECDPDGHPGVGATYEVKSAEPALTFVVHQSYRFDAYQDGTRCEASKTVHCVRFWPTVTWGLLGTDTAVGQGNKADWGLRIVQRFQFDPDAMGADTADVTRDSLVKHTASIDDLGDNGMLTNEGAVLALTNGKIKQWENWHQTFRPMIGLPGIPAPLGGSGYAGCSECVHAHWSWFGGHDSWAVPTSLGQLLACQRPDCWTSGQPQILPGSHQTACAGWVKASAVETSTDWCARVGRDGDSIAPPTPLAFYWDAYTDERHAPGSGVDIKGYPHMLGDSYWPQLPAGNSSNGVNGKLLGDTGAMFIVPARKIVAGSVPAPDAGHALVAPGPAYRNDVAGSRIPTGYVVPVSISFAPGVDDKGPYYLRVHADGITVQNPAPGYTPANTGEPWVDVYDDKAAPTLAQLDVNANTPRVPTHAVPAGQATDPAPMHAFVVFDKMPAASNNVSYELDAAPDGIAYADRYGPDGRPNWPVSTGRWNLADGGGTADVYFPDGVTCACNPVQRPAEFDLTGDSSEWVTGARWFTWTASSASGAGTVNTSCKAVCAPGQSQQTHVGATFTLDTPIAACGKQFFTHLTIRHPGQFPATPPESKTFLQDPIFASDCPTGTAPGRTTPPVTKQPPGPPPASDYSLTVKDGWQYQLADDHGFTLGSTGGGVAGDLHIDTKSAGSLPGLYKDISSGYLLKPGQVGSPLLCGSLLLDKSEFWSTWGPSAPNPLPWGALTTGTQACVDDGANYEVLTVTSPWNGSSISFDVKVWKCTVPAGESVC